MTSPTRIAIRCLSAHLKDRQLEVFVNDVSIQAMFREKVLPAVAAAVVAEGEAVLATLMI